MRRRERRQSQQLRRGNKGLHEVEREQQRTRRKRQSAPVERPVSAAANTRQESSHRFRTKLRNDAGYSRKLPVWRFGRFQHVAIIADCSKFDLFQRLRHDTPLNRHEVCGFKARMFVENANDSR